MGSWFRTAALAAVMAVTATGAQAQSFPEKSVRIFVPYPAGGGVDVLTRTLGEVVSKQWGQSVVVENRPGAGGMIASQALASSPSDGYTLIMVASGHATNAHLYAKLPYDTFKDFTPISLLASSPNLLLVRADSPYKTLADVVAAARAKPLSLNYATSGNGTVAHLATELFQRTANVQLTHVPYKGAAQGATDLIGGQVQLYVSSIPTLIGHIKSGKMRPIAVTSLKRVDDLPQVPTIAESGYKGFEAVTWFGVLGPANLPKDVVARVNAEMIKALQSPDLLKKLSGQGADVASSTPEQFGKLIQDDIARWGKIVKESGAKID